MGSITLDIRNSCKSGEEDGAWLEQLKDVDTVKGLKKLFLSAQNSKLPAQFRGRVFSQKTLYNVIELEFWYVLFDVSGCRYLKSTLLQFQNLEYVGFSSCEIEGNFGPAMKLIYNLPRFFLGIVHCKPAKALLLGLPDIITWKHRGILSGYLHLGAKTERDLDERVVLKRLMAAVEKTVGFRTSKEALDGLSVLDDYLLSKITYMTRMF